MTKIIVVSDNHGLDKEIEDIYFRYKDNVSFFIHCGDSAMSSNHPILKPYICVKGNCDYSKFPNELFFEVEKKKILVVHGHHHSIKYNYDVIYQYAKSKGANLVFFGHTHFPTVYEHHDIIFINPGSILANRGIRGRSYALVEIVDGKVNVQHLDVITGTKYII